MAKEQSKSIGRSVCLVDDPMDALLRDLRLQRSFFCRTELYSPWGLLFTERPHAHFHFVAQGHLFFSINDREYFLKEGDIIVLPHGQTHRLMDQKGRACQDTRSLHHVMLGSSAAILQHGRSEAFSSNKPEILLLCGGFAFETVGLQLAERLPEVLLLRQEEHTNGVAVTFHIEASVFLHEFGEVERGKVAR